MCTVHTDILKGSSVFDPKTNKNALGFLFIRQGFQAAACGFAELGIIALGRTAFDVLEKHIVTASHGRYRAVRIALEDIVGHAGVQRRHRRQSVFAVVVDVVASRNGDVRYH